MFIRAKKGICWMDNFVRCHAMVNAFYFLIIILITFYFFNPIISCITIVSTAVYTVLQKGIKELWRLAKVCIPLCLAAVILNPLFNHRGVTVIGGLAGRPITLESVIFGMATAIFLVAMLILFAVFSRVMTAKKWTVLLGRIFPKFALVFSLGIQLIPALRRDYEQILMAQQGMSQKKSRKKAVLVLIGNGLEDSIDRADSMAARGYLLKTKKTFTGEPFRRRDFNYLLVMGALSVAMFLSADELDWNYFPYISTAVLTDKSIIFYVLYFFFVSIPIILEGKENFKWKRQAQKYFSSNM